MDRERGVLEEKRCIGKYQCAFFLYYNSKNVFPYVKMTEHIYGAACPEGLFFFFAS